MGNPWYFVGFGGTIVFIMIWMIARIPDNFITGRGGRISDNVILTEMFQITFVVLVIAILVLEKRMLIKN